MITVMAGGVGAARFLRALLMVTSQVDVAAVINTADDAVMHGLSISPDIDTVTYTLAEAIDQERGWGLRDETWRTMEALDRFNPVKPPGSTAAPTWFNLGDHDLATHLYRTGRLAEGATLTDVTAEIGRAFGLSVQLLPMTDDRVGTRLNVAAEGEISFQEYFVQRRHSVPITGVRFAGSAEASLTPAARSALEEAAAVIIAPSNPIVSIGPVRALRGVDEILTGRRQSVVAVSPIVAGQAVKGPAERMMRELGHDPTVVGIARIYAPVAATLVIDPTDAHLADQVAAEGIRPLVVESIMSSDEISATLARATLAAAGYPISS